MLTNSLLAGKDDSSILERWRRITVEGIFMTNSAVEDLFNAQLVTAITVLENELKAAYPSSTVYFVGQSEHLQLLNIVRHARQLSFELQHASDTCRYYLTVAPEPTAANDVVGTYAFGLIKLSGGKQTELIAAEAMTKQQLQTFLACEGIHGFEAQINVA